MCLRPITIPVKRTGSDHYEAITVSCGKCLECVQAKSTEWSHRIVDECKLHKDNCFITLTYNDEHLPVGGSLVRRDLQLFIKRLRKHLEPQKIRVFYCGEYGKKSLRPHYHIIIFGWSPTDSFFYKRDKKGVDLFRSPTVERLWSFGFSSVGEVTLDTAKYCAKYMQKFNTLPDSLAKPFIGMSNRNGIGYGSIDPNCLTTDSIFHSGKRIKVPRYYLKVLERDGHDLTDFVARRCLLGKLKENPLQLEQRRKKAKFFLKGAKKL